MTDALGFEINFTGGDYFVEDGEAIRVKDSDNGTVCNMTFLKGEFGRLGRRPTDEVFSTATLFAAAPELYAALAELVFLHGCEQEALRPPTPQQWFDAVNKASEVLQKARGGK